MILEVHSISKLYNNTLALSPISLSLYNGEFVLLTGESGIGKSTLLSIVGGMLPPSTGQIIYEGHSVYHLSSNKRNIYRFNDIGFVFQQFHLMPYLSVLDNIRLGNRSKKDDQSWIQEELSRFNLLGKEHRKPSELSVGERQRVALLRALIRKPNLLIADEPTGSLDKKNTVQILDRIKQFQQEGGTVLMVSHGDDVNAYADRIISM